MSGVTLAPEEKGTTIHTLPIQQVYESLETYPEGLTQVEAEQRLKHHGPNAIKEEKGKPLYVKLISNFTHMMAILLWVGGAVALIAQMPQLAIAIWLVNLINGAFSFWQEFRAEQATEALQQLIPHYVRVLRDGAEQRLLAEALAVSYTHLTLPTN